MLIAAPGKTRRGAEAVAFDQQSRGSVRAFQGTADSCPKSTVKLTVCQA